MVKSDEYARVYWGPMSGKARLIVALVFVLVLGGGLAVLLVRNSGPNCPSSDRVVAINGQVRCLSPGADQP